MRAQVLVVLLCSCAGPQEVWTPPTSQWPVEVGMDREALFAVWPGGFRQDLEREGRAVEVYWLYSVLQPVVIADDLVLGWAMGTTHEDARAEPLHPDLEGIGIRSTPDEVRARLGEPAETLHFQGEGRNALQLWSYGAERPRYVFYQRPMDDGLHLAGLAVGFEELD